MMPGQKPWNRRQFLAVGGIAIIAGALIVAKFSIQAETERLREDNSFIQRENRKLSPETEEVAPLREHIGIFLARKQVVEAIDKWAVPAAEAMAALSRLPEKVRLTGLAIDGSRMSVLGEADSEGDAASALQAWSDSPVVHHARIAASGPVPAAGAPAPGRHAFRMEAEISFSPPRGQP